MAKHPLPVTEHVPFPNAADVRQRLGTPACTFMTGYGANARAQLPGVQCILRRLRAIESSVPLVIVVPENETETATAALPPLRASREVITEWRHFPSVPNRQRGTSAWAAKYRHSHTHDKLNVFGAPFAARVVWLDTDLTLMRNVDELCTENASFAAVLNHGYEMRTCWNSANQDDCRDCRHTFRRFDGSQEPMAVPDDEVQGSFWLKRAWNERYAANRSGTPVAERQRCVYEVNTGVMSVAPLPPTLFHESVVAPVSSGLVSTRDGSDQGTINNLLHDRRVFGTVGHLEFGYNANDRARYIHPRAFRRWGPAVVHSSGEKPWQPKHANNSGLTFRFWRSTCSARTR